MKIDPIDELVMKGIYENKTILEICEDAHRAPAAIHQRLLDLQAGGYITPPPAPHMARMRRLTQAGENYLSTHGYISKLNKVFPQW